MMDSVLGLTVEGTICEHKTQKPTYAVFSIPKNVEYVPEGMRTKYVEFCMTATKSSFEWSISFIVLYLYQQILTTNDKVEIHSCHMSYLQCFETDWLNEQIPE